MALTKMNLEVYKQRVYNVWGNSVRVLGNVYKNMQTGIPVECTKCGYGRDGSWRPRPCNLLNHHGCPKCSKKSTRAKRIMDKEDFYQKVHDLLGKDYKIIGKYKNANAPIQIEHIVCGYKRWFVTLSDLRRGVRCPKCRGVARTTIKEFSSYVQSKTVGHYRVLSDCYVNNRTPVRIEHLDCGTIYFVTPHNFKSGYRCPHCHRSHGEYKIQCLLEINNMRYEFQKRFKDCKYKRTLPFDFYLPEQKIAIEYDGKQHYQANHFFMKHTDLSLYQLRDHIKDYYCQSHGIYLIRIPYTAKTTEQIKSYLYML